MSKFRSTGDIVFTDTEQTLGQISSVYIKSSSTACNTLQYLSPLTPERPYFSAQIRTLAPGSKVTIGISGPNLSSNNHPGHFLNSVGYHSDTGHCYTSHQCVANTNGHELKRGDVLGVLVTYFGEKKSTVTFLKNAIPVATRFLFEPLHINYLPTITLENGPIDLGIMWPEAVVHAPTFSKQNMLHWICPASVSFDVFSKSFVHHGEGDAMKELIIQSPQPLSQACQHFEVILDEHPSPLIALAGCSPMIPPSSSSLAQDFIQFGLNSNQTSLLAGHRIGWGVHYSPELRDKPGFNPKAEQLVYCYVTADLEVISGEVIMQPEGGFYPTVVISPGVSKVAVDIETNSRPAVLTDLLDSSFRRKMVNVTKEMRLTMKKTEVKRSMLRTSKDMEVTVTSECCKLRLSHDKPGIHVVQFERPLTEESNYFLVCIRSLHVDSAVGVGVAGKNFPLAKFPGEFAPSVGWVSMDGRLYRNSKHDGNLPGDKFYEGDMVGAEIEVFGKNMSIALFTKNLHPVGTVYYTQSNRAEFLPTIALCSNGHDVVVEVFWQNMIQKAPFLNVANLEHWCLPPESKVDHRTNTVYVKDHQIPVCIQSPYSLRKGYNHFEVCLTKKFSHKCPQPAIILSTATPLEPPPKSCLKLDFLRFWAIEEGASNFFQFEDLVGWGLMYIDETLPCTEEQLVICYLTINRRVVLVRVVYQPPGGFYPLVVLPPGLNEVTFELSATVTKRLPINNEDIEILVSEAKELMEKEKSVLEKGDDLAFELASSDLFRSLPIKNTHEVNANMMFEVEMVASETINNRPNRETNKTITTIIDSPFHDKKSTGSSSKLYADQKNSVSCAIL